MSCGSDACAGRMLSGYFFDALDLDVDFCFIYTSRLVEQESHKKVGG